MSPFILLLSVLSAPVCHTAFWPLCSKSIRKGLGTSSCPSQDYRSQVIKITWEGRKDDLLVIDSPASPAICKLLPSYLQTPTGQSSLWLGDQFFQNQLFSLLCIWNTLGCVQDQNNQRGFLPEKKILYLGAYAWELRSCWWWGWFVLGGLRWWWGNGLSWVEGGALVLMDGKRRWEIFWLACKFHTLVYRIQATPPSISWLHCIACIKWRTRKVGWGIRGTQWACPRKLATVQSPKGTSL